MAKSIIVGIGAQILGSKAKNRTELAAASQISSSIAQNSDMEDLGLLDEIQALPRNAQVLWQFYVTTPYKEIISNQYNEKDSIRQKAYTTAKATLRAIRGMFKFLGAMAETNPNLTKLALAAVIVGLSCTIPFAAPAAVVALGGIAGLVSVSGGAYTLGTQLINAKQKKTKLIHKIRTTDGKLQELLQNWPNSELKDFPKKIVLISQIHNKSTELGHSIPLSALARANFSKALLKSTLDNLTPQNAQQTAEFVKCVAETHRQAMALASDEGVSQSAKSSLNALLETECDKPENTIRQYKDALSAASQASEASLGGAIGRLEDAYMKLNNPEAKQAEPIQHMPIQASAAESITAAATMEAAPTDEDSPRQSATKAKRDKRHKQGRRSSPLAEGGGGGPSHDEAKIRGEEDHMQQRGKATQKRGKGRTRYDHVGADPQDIISELQKEQAQAHTITVRAPGLDIQITTTPQHKGKTNGRKGRSGGKKGR